MNNTTSCVPWQSDTFVAAGGQVASIIVLSHLFKLLLKPVGQTSPLAQVLAGFVLGPSALSRIHYVQENVMSINSSKLYFEPLAMLCRMIFLFLIGLEMDIPYLRRDLRTSIFCAAGGILVCSVLAGVLCPLMLYLKRPEGVRVGFWSIVFITMSIASAATPLVVCMATELKIATSDVGRLAIYSAVITDLACLIMVDFGNFPFHPKTGILCIFIVGGVIFLNNLIAGWLNQRNMDQKYLKNAHFLCIVALIVLAADFMESNGYHGPVACFLIGIFFPRGGKTARTLLHRLSSYLHIFILPVYFGYVGLHADITQLRDLESWAVLLLVVLSTVAGKIVGTAAACRYLKIPLAQVLVLPLLLSLKVYVEFLKKDHAGEFDVFYENIETTVVVINIAVLAPVATFIVRRDRSLAYTPVALELQNPENELRVLACVCAPRHVSTMVWLVGASSTQKRKPTVPYLIHLVELPARSPADSGLTYHQLDADELSDEDDYGGDDVAEVNEALDAFVAQTGIIIRQVKAVAPLSAMCEEVCAGADDIRASIVLLPFHKHQRIDGMMERDSEGIRTTNQRVLRRAPCTAAILVDRGLAGAPHGLSDPESVHVATLFFGGVDDREALAYSVRICGHPQVNLTVIRFIPQSPSKRPGPEMGAAAAVEDEIAGDEDIKKGVDDTAISIFYNRFVATGQAGYVEKRVANGGQTAAALREMGDMYSLFIVGKGGRGHLQITTQMSDWEECPELGTVGDLLASSDLDINGSVLVIQQRRPGSSDGDDV